MELARHSDVTRWAGLEVYFADPRSPWQRGTNENTNGLLRQYFPKGISMAQLTQADLGKLKLATGVASGLSITVRTLWTVPH